MVNSWNPSQLSEVVDIHTAKVSVDEANLITYISTDNLLPDFGGVVEAEKMPISGKVTSYKVGDVLFSNIRTYFKKLWLADQDGSCSNDVIVFRPKNGISSEYIYHLLMNQEFIEYTVKTSKGTKMPRGDKDAIMKYEFSLAPASERLKIGNSLIQFKSKIELNRQTNQTLEQMAQALFKSWFVDFDPVFDNALASGMAVNDFPVALQKKALARQTLMQQKGKKKEQEKGQTQQESQGHQQRQYFPSEFEQTDEPSIGINGWIPKGWNIEAVSKAIQVNPKTSLPKKTVAKFADMKAIPTSGYMVDEVIEKEYKGGSKFIEKDILFARITPCLQNGKTALVDFLSDGEVGFGSTEFIILRQKNKISYPFVACLAREDGFRAHCMQSMVGSSGRQRVQNACFDDYYLALPDKKELLDQFTAMTSPNFLMMTANKLESQSLTKLRETLLPKLISGELTLPADNNLTATAKTEAS